MSYIVSVVTDSEVIEHERSTLAEAEALSDAIMSFKYPDDKILIHNICEVCGELYPAYTQHCKGIVV